MDTTSPDEPRQDEDPPTADALADEEQERDLEEGARGLSVANDLDTGPPRHD